MKIRKAVIPAAGFGTRFLPQTKAMPKQMMPIVDKPIIQFVVEELVEAGITDIILVTNMHERAIEDHFDDPHNDLIENLKLGGKDHLIEPLREISRMANFVYVRQKGPYGNGTPLLNVRHLIGNEPFIYTWSDDFMVAEPSMTKQLITVYEKYKCSVMASIKATKDEDYKRYGFAGGKELEPGIIDCDFLIEKPGKDSSPSNLGTTGGSLFTPDIFDYLDEAIEKMGDGDELYYNDILKLMLADKKQVLAAEIKGAVYYDTGNKFEYMKTVVDFALKHPDINGEFRTYLKGLKL